MSVLRQRVKTFLKAEDGPTAVEYGLLLALIMGAMIITMATFGESVNGLYIAISTATSTP
ncbi:MAG: Flp family type IVb pilin [Planctomycetes bacterium]|nr:Flp family type IVb pilin [Planctomycetota bacterium]